MGTALHQRNEPIAPPPGIRGARGNVLVELKRAQPLSAKDLADRLGMSLNAVRHHLKELEVSSLVVHERSYGSVGAPAFLYSLTESGEAMFPHRYQQALTHLLDHLVAREGRAAAVSLLESRFRDVALRLCEELEGAPLSERVAALSRFLSDEGYMPEWHGSGEGEQSLVEHNCPIRAVAERFPEICAAEARFLAEVLGAAVQRTSHMVEGCGSCEYHVRPGLTGLESSALGNEIDSREQA